MDYWKTIIGRTVQPYFPSHIQHAPEYLQEQERTFRKAKARLAKLTRARHGLGIDDLDIARAFEAVKRH